MLVYWCIGVIECWNAGVLEPCWDAGIMLECWNANALAALLHFGISALLNCCIAGFAFWYKLL